VVCAGCADEVVDPAPRTDADADHPPNVQVETGIRFWLTDFPTDEVDAVFVTIERLDITHSDDPDRNGEVLTVARDLGEFDLLTLQNGVRAPLGIFELPSGFVRQFRLVISDARIVIDGGVVGAHVLYLAGPFGEAEFTFASTYSELSRAYAPFLLGPVLSSGRQWSGLSTINDSFSPQESVFAWSGTATSPRFSLAARMPTEASLPTLYSWGFLDEQD